MVESSHGGGYHGKDEGMKPLDQQYQFFGELGFPVKRETEAWKEKVSYICSWKIIPNTLCIYLDANYQFYG